MGQEGQLVGSRRAPRCQEAARPLSQRPLNAKSLRRVSGHTTMRQATPQESGEGRPHTRYTIEPTQMQGERLFAVYGWAVRDVRRPERSSSASAARGCPNESTPMRRYLIAPRAPASRRQTGRPTMASSSRRDRQETFAALVAGQPRAVRGRGKASVAQRTSGQTMSTATKRSPCGARSGCKATSGTYLPPLHPLAGTEYVTVWVAPTVFRCIYCKLRCSTGAGERAGTSCRRRLLSGSAAKHLMAMAVTLAPEPRAMCKSAIGKLPTCVRQVLRLFP